MLTWHLRYDYRGHDGGLHQDCHCLASGWTAERAMDLVIERFAGQGFTVQRITHCRLYLKFFYLGPTFSRNV